MDFEQIYVSIIEDDEVFRNEIVNSVNGTPNLKCIGAYNDCESAIKVLDDNVPDVLLLDIGLPGMTGLQCAKYIKDKYPKIEIIMLTVLFDDEKIFQSLKSGASGYLIKKNNYNEVIEGIQDIYNGGSPMSMGVARKVTNYFREKKFFPQLSDREKEVLSNIREGKNNKQISVELHCSIANVRFHCKNIYRKLHVSNKLQAVIKWQEIN